MGTEELRKLLEETQDKFGVFADREKLVEYDFNVVELTSLIRDFLNDDENLKLFELSHFKYSKPILKSSIIKTIIDEETKVKLMLETNLESDYITDIINDLKEVTKLKLLLEENIANNLGTLELISVIEGLENDSKIKILNNTNFLYNNKINEGDITRIIKSLNDESKEKLLQDKNIIKQNLKLENYYIKEIICDIKTENLKFEMIGLYDFYKSDIVDILTSFSDETKREILINNKYDLKKFDIKKIISSQSLLDFMKENKQIIEKNDIKPYEIIIKLTPEAQLDFISNFENIGLSIKEKKQILAMLGSETKEQIDKTNFSEEYLDMLEMKVREEIGFEPKVIVDYNENLEKYKDLDEILYIKPINITDVERQRLLQLCDICPEIKIADDIVLGFSTASEYKNAEMWIDSILQGIQEDWSDIQKVAYIDNAIGRKISYSPDFKTEVFDEDDSRALWKIINSGYGVCNGISQMEKYILDRIGIESEMISGERHAFLKLKNITLPTKDGNTITGDTILDPTWNLATHRYGGKPGNFCRSYEEIRKRDICNGEDKMCHKNDEELASVTLDLDEDCLRDIFKSIGLADREGDFPISDFFNKSDEIYNSEISQEEMIEQQFALLAQYRPDFAKCQNSTMTILKCKLLNNEKLDFNRCVVKRVYDRNDENKRPIIYTYVDLSGVGKKFYYGDGDSKQFIKLSQKEFEERFECYEMDIKALNGKRDWEIDLDIDEPEDLSRSSGKVATKEGEER